MPSPLAAARHLSILVLIAGACRYSSDPVVARIGPLKITQSEFQRKLSDVAAGYQGYVLTPNGRRQFLDILIREKLVLAAAMKSDVPRSPEFKAEVSRMRAEEEERLREGREDLMVRMWKEHLRGQGTLKAAEEECREYHKKYPTEVSVRHILLGNPEEAGEAAKKIRAGGSFAAMAKASSLDAATAADGGRFPPQIYGEVFPELEEVVFRMRVGEVSGPIKSKFGYHILRKDSERALPFEEARDRVGLLIERQKLDRYLRSMQEKFPVEVVDAQFK